MQYWHEWEGCELVYLPLYQPKSIGWDAIFEYLIYRFPVLRQPEFAPVLSTLKVPPVPIVNEILDQAGIREAAGSAFLLYTDEQRQKTSRPFELLAAYHPKDISPELFFVNGFEALWAIRSNEQDDNLLIAESTSNLVSLSYDIPEGTERILSSRSWMMEDETVPVLSAEIKAQLQHLEQLGNQSAIIQVVIHLLNNLNPTLNLNRDSMQKLLQQHWERHVIHNEPSRLHIGRHHQLTLTDYGQTEIKLTPLHKTLFLFYLAHPEGVEFKKLVDYREELAQIYEHVANRSDKKEMQKSINELVNPVGNSINEKCSRIKEAFLKVMDERMAKHYFISGPRGGAKRIGLDRSLVTFESVTLQGCKD